MWPDVRLEAMTCLACARIKQLTVKHTVRKWSAQEQDRLLTVSKLVQVALGGEQEGTMNDSSNGETSDSDSSEEQSSSRDTSWDSADLMSDTSNE